MYLAYLDESGDTGTSGSPTRFYVLSCVLVHESNWLSVLDLIIGLRRNLKAVYGIPTRAEIKAADFRSGSGILRPLGWSRNQRIQLYRELMQYQDQGLSIKTFAIAIEKDPAKQRGWEARLAAWTFALQRINRFCGEEEWATIYPDEGHGFFIRRRMREMRRHHVVPSYFGAGTVPFPTQRIVEDPNERASQDSYFIQVADWNARAAHRSSYVDPYPTVPSDLWDELGSTILLEVNALRGGPPGIVKYP